MPKFELILPKMGESVAEASIIKWLKRVGEEIKEDEAIVEIATDKVDSDVPSPVSGILTEILLHENEIAQVGEVIAIIETDEVSDTTAAKPERSSAPEIEAIIADQNEMVIPGIENISEEKEHASGPQIKSNSTKFYSPLVKSIAAEEGISADELDTISGTGAEGRVTKQDLLDYVKSRSADTRPSSVFNTVEQGQQQPPPFAASSGDEIIEMDRMRRLISEHMLKSVQTAPHVTSFVESDVTNIVKWRERNRASIEQKIGEKITFTPIFIQAVAKAIRDFPMINISLDGTKIIKKKDINIGLAAALPSGNLIVPVIKSADQLNLIGLTKAVNDLANRSKTNKLQPDEVKDGTFTITNIGSFGNIMGTPIINQPQVAILAIGMIQKKPAVIETEYGDVVGIRHKMFLSLSYDHRIVDGALGGMFLKRISDYLEAWDINYKI